MPERRVTSQLTCTDALLTVASTLQFAHFAVWVHCAQKHGLELVHAGICEQQGRVIEWHLQIMYETCKGN